MNMNIAASLGFIFQWFNASNGIMDGGESPSTRNTREINNIGNIEYFLTTGTTKHEFNKLNNNRKEASA